ncbi:MAG: 50S ribosomal protein L18 [Phycisphaerales bacterium JB065]
MDRQKRKAVRRSRRRVGIRRKISGTPARPRLAVYRSLNHIYVQVIDDINGRTIASASTRDKDISSSNSGNTEAAALVGKQIAEKAKAAGITAVAMDRSGFKYHGRIKALADAAREGGLQF